MNKKTCGALNLVYHIQKSPIVQDSWLLGKITNIEKQNNAIPDLHYNQFI